jgi:hypothetical protein
MSQRCARKRLEDEKYDKTLRRWKGMSGKFWLMSAWTDDDNETCGYAKTRSKDFLSIDFIKRT